MAPPKMSILKGSEPTFARPPFCTVHTIFASEIKRLCYVFSCFPCGVMASCRSFCACCFVFISVLWVVVQKIISPIYFSHGPPAAVLITGTSSGLGRHSTFHLAEKGTKWVPVSCRSHCTSILSHAFFFPVAALVGFWLDLDLDVLCTTSINHMGQGLASSLAQGQNHTHSRQKDVRPDCCPRRQHLTELEKGKHLGCVQ